MTTVRWVMKPAVYDTYHELLDKIEKVAEFSPDWHSLVDELQSLPGFPIHVTELDEIDPQLNVTRR